MRTPTAFIFGALAATLVAAAAFRGAGQPLDSTFTYQGQLRNAGQLVNGPVDVRFTLWDSDVAGLQIGTANSFNNYPLADGRFALGLNFGTGAFNGDQRWVQVEFRNPAGFGQYLTLNPRDKIMATPYALYALNGTASRWDYNSKTQALTAAASVTKVGIGTSTPTATLEVVNAAGGDDTVKLPARSIGVTELAVTPGAVARFSPKISFGSPSASKRFTTDRDCHLLISGVARGGNKSQGYIQHQVLVDGVSVAAASTWFDGGWTRRTESALVGLLPLPAGEHEIVLQCTSELEPTLWYATDDIFLQAVPALLFE
jgi:hypothetical protein